MPPPSPLSLGRALVFDNDGAPELPVCRSAAKGYSLGWIDEFDGASCAVTHEVMVQLLGQDHQPLSMEEADTLVLECKWNKHAEWFLPGTTQRVDLHQYHLFVPD